MPFPCPYCRHTISIKNPKPGKYKPKCPGCGKAFQLTVPPGDDVQPRAEAILDETLAGDAPPTTVKMPAAKPAAPKPSPSAEDKTGVFAPPAADATQATGVFAEPKAAASDATGVFAPPANDNTVVEPAKTQTGADDDKDFSVKMPSKINIEDDTEGGGEVPESIGGYKVVKELGRGGMGAVYLAIQQSLDRQVALKVMNPAWGSDPGFVARFMREAYAAAQLTHHNVVQIYDFGKHHDMHFFSMEFVDGKSLGDMVKKDGKLDVETAVTLTLQAARGLKFAHERGMIHRDIKPDNLMLNNQGMVKVADLGLVKAPGVKEDLAKEEAAAQAAAPAKGKLAESAASNVTRVGIAMGTPAYMSPEQAKDAAHVDQRADVYSLGCTLYVLLTGKPPFEGKTVMELFTKHATAPIVPPDAIVKRVPKELSVIIQKMVAKKPEDRYADMDEVARVLEDWLGQKGERKTASMSEEQISKLEDCVKKYNDVGLAKLRTLARVAIVGGCAAFAFLFLLMGWLKFSFGALMLAAETGLASFLIGGWFNPSPLFQRVREYVFGLSWKTYLKAAVGLLLFLVILVLFNLIWVWLIITILAVALGAGLYFVLDRTVDVKRQPALEATEELLKKLRVSGMDEESLRNFVCKYSGANWEEFYEGLFGYEEKLKARDWWVRGQQGQQRQKFAAWRDPIISAIDARLRTRREEADRIKLRQLEEERLKASGMSSAEAREKADQAADRIVQAAAELRQEPAGPAAGEPLRKPRKISAVMLEDIELAPTPPPRKKPGFDKIIGKALNLIMGPTLRFVLGVALLAGCLFWMYSNDLVAKAKAVEGVGDAWRLLQAEDAVSIDKKYSVVPAILGKWFDGYGPGLAGLLLLISALLPHWSAAIVMPIAAIVAVFGKHLGVPDIGPLTGSQLSMAVAGVIGLIGIVLGRLGSRG